MKKTINGKSYNTEYDSKFLAEYRRVVDGWDRTHCELYQKKSTGEYFEYWKWSEWNDGWDIHLVEDQRAEKIISMTQKGYDHLFMALMASFKRLKRGKAFWGKEKDAPWETMEEKKTRFIAGEYAEMQFTGCSKAKKLYTFGKRKVKDEDYGKVVFYKVNFRWVDNTFDKKSENCSWYRNSINVVMEAEDKTDPKDVVRKMEEEILDVYGKWDVVMKDGKLTDFSEKNKLMAKELYNMMEDRNTSIAEKYLEA